MAKLVQKYAQVETDADRPVFRATRFEPDSVGDRVDVSSLKLDTFEQNPICLAQHSRNTPIGYWEFEVIGEGANAELLVSPVFANTPKGREYKQLVEDKAIRAVSVGFRPDPEKTLENEFGGYDYHSATLVEVSLVSAPALPSAIRVKGRNMRKTTKKEDGQENPLDRLEALLARLEAAVSALEAKQDEEEKEDTEDEEEMSDESEEEKALSALLKVLR